MYEFIDRNGERVTVRSARTLGALLGDGRIDGRTPFRRAEEPEYVPAARHAELARIALDSGVTLIPPSPPTPPPAPAPPSTTEAPRPTVPAPVEPQPPPEPTALLPGPPSPPAPQPAGGRGPWSRGPMAGVSGVPVAAAIDPSPAPAPPPPPSPHGVLGPQGWRVLVVVFHFLGMAGAGLVAGAGASGLTHNGAVGAVAGVMAFIASGHFAGRMLARRSDMSRGWEVWLAIALVCGISGVIGGWRGLILSALASVALWRGLNRPGTGWS